MPSYLERIPLDVLTHIALFTIDPSPTSSLDALLQLQLSCRHVHRLLALESCSQLYARIFREKFDLDGHSRRERDGTRTTSCLAAELRARRRVLRRIRLSSQIRGQDTLGDLWTTYLMLLESDALNEVQLQSAGVGDWVLHILRECYLQASHERDEHVLALAVSVARLVLSHSQISSMPVGDRNQVLNLLRPYTAPAPKCLLTNVSGATGRRISVSTSRSQDRGPEPPTTNEISDEFDAHLPQTSYYSRFTISIPDLPTASVFLTFALLEATPLQVPPHLPPTRAVAIATERHGPSMADFAEVASRRTPLVADSFFQSQCRESNTDLARERQRPSRSVVHDEDFYRIARPLHVHAGAWELAAYIPGLLTGVWEGSYMVAPLTSCPSAGTPAPDDFLCRQPIQFRLEEYVTFSPWLPLPIESQDGFDGHVVRNLAVSEQAPTEIQFSDGSAEKTYHYEPVRLSGASESGRNLRHALDVVIAGETPHRFEAAWGSYSFIGRVRLSDGLISLTRKPKDAADDGCGTWVFEGYIYSRSTFAGRWGTLNALGQEGIGGIFSVSKTEPTGLSAH